MIRIAAIGLCGLLLGCQEHQEQAPVTPVTPQQRLDGAKEKLAKAKTDAEKFYALNDAAKQSFVLGHIDEGTVVESVGTEPGWPQHYAKVLAFEQGPREGHPAGG
jgi:hypothetical protein